MFHAHSLTGPAGLKGLQGLATLGSLALLPDTLTARFGRVLRSYPAPARLVAPALGELRRRGLAASSARLAARVLARLADAAEQLSQQWLRDRERRRTERALRGLDARGLRDIGFTRGEISSVAAEAAGEIEATRQRAWLEIGSRVV